jgi:hypothetical protein
VVRTGAAVAVTDRTVEERWAQHLVGVSQSPSWVMLEILAAVLRAVGFMILWYYLILPAGLTRNGIAS